MGAIGAKVGSEGSLLKYAKFVIVTSARESLGRMEEEGTRGPFLFDHTPEG